MADERAKILNMLKEGKISVEEAEELLDAIEKGGKIEYAVQDLSKPPKSPKYLRVLVEGKGDNKEKVNIKVPLALIRAGVKMKSFIPGKARDKIDSSFCERGMRISLDEINPENVEELIEALGEMSIDAEEEDVKVRVFCE